jgi:hypothetical protein
MHKRYRDSVISNTSSDQFARTPSWLLNRLTTTFGITYDACPSSPIIDGLTTPWEEFTYCNPPYNRIGQWLSKADNEWKERKVTSIFLIPVRLYAKYMKPVLSGVTAIYFASHLIKFEEYKSALGIGLCIWVHGNGNVHNNIPFQIGILHVNSPYSISDACSIFEDNQIPFVIALKDGTRIATEQYTKWKQNPSHTYGVLMSAHTKLLIFHQIILPEATYIGFCDHLLKEKPGSHEFWIGSMAIVFGPGGNLCYNNTRTIKKIPAGIFDTSDPDKKIRKRRHISILS